MALSPTKESIFDVLEMVRRKPGLYLGGKSIIRLQAFLSGYDSGLGRFHAVLSRYEEFHPFHDWVANRLGFNNSVPGWCNLILKRSSADETAYDQFFVLLDEFKAERGI